MSRILYISYDGMSDPLGQSQVLPYLRGLCKQGHEIVLLSFEKPAARARAGGALRRSIEGAGIEWHPLKYHARPPVLSAVYDLERMKRKALKLAKGHATEIVHCRGYLPAMAGALLKDKTGARMIFDMRGFWPDERVDGGLWPQKHFLYRQIYRFFKKEEQRLLRQADRVVSLTEAGKKIIHEKLAGPGVPVAVIPTCTDMQHFDYRAISADEIRSMKAKAGIPRESFVLGYVGSTGTWYLLREMFLFFKRLQAQCPAVFLIVSRDDEEKLKAEAALLGIDPAQIVVRAAAYAEMPRWISLFDAGLFFIKPAFSKQASSPTKMGEILAMGKPLICNAGVGDVAGLVRRFDCGRVLETLDEESYDRAIGDMDVLAEAGAAHFREAAAQYFSLEHGVEEYHRIYESLK